VIKDRWNVEFQLRNRLVNIWYKKLCQHDSYVTQPSLLGIYQHSISPLSPTLLLLSLCILFTTFSPLPTITVTHVLTKSHNLIYFYFYSTTNFLFIIARLCVWSTNCCHPHLIFSILAEILYTTGCQNLYPHTNLI